MFDDICRMRKSWGFVLWVIVGDDFVVEDVNFEYEVFEVFLVFNVKVDRLFLKFDKVVIDCLLIVDLIVV